MAALVCPNCGSPELRSEERAVIAYPITASVNDHGKRTHDYTGDSYKVYDDDTQFEDVVICPSCAWAGNLTALKPEETPD